MRLEFPPLAVDRVEFAGERTGRGGIVAEQAADADGHVVDAAGGVESRRDLETESPGRDLTRLGTGDGRQREKPGAGPPRPDSTQPFPDQDPVVAVERHQVSDGTERDEIEQVGDRRQADTALALELARNRCHQVKRDADASERVAAEYGMADSG